MVQLPELTNVTAAPVTVHTLPVEELKLTPKPELAVAERLSGAPTV
jgi:hypothetical protein